jgi:hypothetical protein
MCWYGHRTPLATEDGVLGDISLGIFADKKGRRLPARELNRQAFQEALQVNAAIRGPHDGAERIHHHDTWADCSTSRWMVSSTASSPWLRVALLKFT